MVSPIFFIICFNDLLYYSQSRKECFNILVFFSFCILKFTVFFILFRLYSYSLFALPDFVSHRNSILWEEKLWLATPIVDLRFFGMVFGDDLFISCFCIDGVSIFDYKRSIDLEKKEAKNAYMKVRIKYKKRRKIDAKCLSIVYH